MKKYLVGLVILALIELGFSLWLTFWRENFWNYIEAKNYGMFTYEILLFLGVALCICFVVGISGYILSLTAIRWREILNTKAQSLVHNSETVNVPQRIQEDCGAYPDLMLNIGWGFLKAIAYVLVFSATILYNFSWLYLAVLVGYSIVGTFLTHIIAKPLIKLNYDNQQAEATYRNELSISNFQNCIAIMFNLARRQKHLTYFQQFYGQIGVVVPLILVAPLYFTTAMPLGTLIRFNSTAATILDNMSYGISSFAAFNRLLSCRKRLKEINVL